MILWLSWKEQKCSKETLVSFPLAVRMLKQWSPRNWNVHRNYSKRKKNGEASCQPEKLISGERFHKRFLLACRRAWSWCQEWCSVMGETQLDHDTLNLNLILRPQRWMSGWVHLPDLITCPSFHVATLNKSLFYFSLCYLLPCLSLHLIWLHVYTTARTGVAGACLVEVILSFHHELKGSDSGCQPQLRAPLPVEPSHWLTGLFNWPDMMGGSSVGAASAQALILTMLFTIHCDS